MLNKKIVKDFSEFDAPYLLKFLRARSFDIELTTKMFEECLEWRKTQDFNYLMQINFTKQRELTSVYPRFYHKTDKLGRPIYIELVSQTKFDEIFKIVEENLLIDLTLK